MPLKPFYKLNLLLNLTSTAVCIVPEKLADIFIERFNLGEILTNNWTNK
jgi:hypothetical protein